MSCHYTLHVYGVYCIFRYRDAEGAHCQGACHPQWFFNYVPLSVSETAPSCESREIHSLHRWWVRIILHKLARGGVEPVGCWLGRQTLPTKRIVPLLCPLLQQWLVDYTVLTAALGEYFRGDQTFSCAAPKSWNVALGGTQIIIHGALKAQLTVHLFKVHYWHSIIFSYLRHLIIWTLECLTFEH